MLREINNRLFRQQSYVLMWTTLYYFKLTSSNPSTVANFGGFFVFLLLLFPNMFYELSFLTYFC